MRFTYSWLLDCLGTEHPAKSLADVLTNVGVEACLVESGSRCTRSFVVAKVEEVAAHPNANKLSVCKVFDGEKTLQVVCGAPNVQVGMVTVLAHVGAVVPQSGIVINKAAIRGIDSEGMLCSLAELGISSEYNSDGIADLADYEIGEDFFASHEVIEVSVTPNRGDCLGVYGIARELAAAGMGALKELPEPDIGRSLAEAPIKVDMRANGVFSGRYIQAVNNSQRSPRWIRERLEASGIKTISCVVDIINYVTILLNRPMHVYDADKIKGGCLIVEKASAGCFSALNGKVYDIDSEDVVIKDREGNIHCLAGIIGSDFSKCTCDTQNIFLEAAWYDPVDIVLSSRRLKLNTDSSYRFSRGTDARSVSLGLDYATYLITKYCGGIVYGSVVSGKMPEERVMIDFDPKSIWDIGSVAMGRDRVLGVLQSLGFVVDTVSETVWKVEVPSWRWNDISSANDLVEEVLRISGYDEIQEQVVLPVRGKVEVEKRDIVNSRVRAAMLTQGLTEVVTLSFLGASVVEKLGFVAEDLRIENPISNHFDTMRPTVLTNLLQITSTNHAFGRDSIAIFEVGDVYTALDLSEQVVCGIRSGGDAPRNPHTMVRKFDFFDVKNDVENVFLQFGIRGRDLELQETSKTYLHPGKSADIYYRNKFCGYVGELHPELAEFFELKHQVACFEVFLSRIASCADNTVKAERFYVNKFQVVRRDFAFVLDKNVKAGSLVAVVEAIKHVESVAVFDVYVGDGIPEDKVSMAIMVTITSKVGTMTDAEIKEVTDGIVQAVKDKLGGQPRLD
ncbi:phenylalanine--tRNA ligase subunit beta [Candidatus Anaplasma sp. TIGMIC]|uniref:phenylalanine--tRNA ligase subunit beta n=1 Tax=Candidatus Anaplasma sp. TIGMIC TaxID=3020713 RepID=UPI00232D30E4|nr:phenylalanine--tRNA ligase subunit beta [Candidatus Anaplasma sp. TIGMIC]MDB1135235.1 phenylalanine--tRNA ligase subunit beta [Candidatus Anaplasma sp. TIGMIC]